MARTIGIRLGLLLSLMHRSMGQKLRSIEESHLVVSSTLSGDSPLISSLLGRIRSLERKAASEEGRCTNTDLSFREDTGQFLKSKYYGQSHWMNAIDPVSIFQLRIFFERPAS
jgi:hypothetical protein